MKRRFFPAIALWALAAAAAGQTLYMGTSPLVYELANPGPLEPDGVQTFVDLYAPASATGTIETAGFNWSGAPCPAAVKLKVFRRRGETLVFVAERGPFDAQQNDLFQNRTDVTLEPPIQVQQGDLIGVSRVSDCGGPRVYPYLAAGGPHDELPTEGLARFEGDLVSDVPFSSGRIEAQMYRVAVSAAGPAIESIDSVIPVVGSTPGRFGSYFRTAIQLSNLSPSPMSGRFVFHSTGTPSSPDDPDLSYSIEPRSTVAFTDVVEDIGETGLGTLDIVIPVTTGVPLITARVYNDGGDQGTTGFTEDAIPPACCTDSRVLDIGSTSVLVAPADPARFRFNIGIRSLFKAPTLTFTVVGTSAQATRSYPPNTLIQQPVEDLLGPIPANALIAIDVSAGTAIVYGATVDNTTNDPSLQYARIVSASPNQGFNSARSERPRSARVEALDP